MVVTRNTLTLQEPQCPLFVETRFDQSQSQHQLQTIAPQIQQSLALLQAPTLELRQMIQQELESNPVLEDETVDISLEDAGSGDEGEDDFDAEFAELSQLDEEWRLYMAQSRSGASNRDDADERHRFLMDSLVEPKTLQDHLTDQLLLADITQEERELGAMLIGNIDERGFLQANIEDLCYSQGIPLSDLESAQALIQSFDPVGVGATDLRECLLIQLDRLGKRQGTEWRIVDEFIDDLARHRYPQIAKRLSITPEEVTVAAAFIATLDPRPGSRFAVGVNQFVTADVVVEKIDGIFLVSLNGDQIPHLRISNAYKDMMAGGASGEARSYIREKIKAGKFLIRAIHQRQQTVESIAKEIVRRQAPFLHQGLGHLVPMTMAQVAEVVGVHETTVSRAVSGKYISTPHGVFEMKYFFTTGLMTESGESVSNSTVKQALGGLVSAESTKKPLSDQQIVAELKKQGIDIARRTVAKYREELNILPSHLRRTY